VVGRRSRVRVVKNKVAPPFKEAEFDIMYGEGISKEGDLLDLAVENRIVDKSGAWFSFQGERLGQGRENAKGRLKSDPELARSIEQRVREALRISIPSAPDETEPAPPGGAPRKAAARE